MKSLTVAALLALLPGFAACTGPGPDVSSTAAGTPQATMSPAPITPSSSVSTNPVSTPPVPTEPEVNNTGSTDTPTSPTSTSPTVTVVTETPSAGVLHRTMVVIIAPAVLAESSGVDQCSGTGEYASVAEGDVVRVVDGSGGLLTSAPLGAGRRSGQVDDCTWSAEVLLPTDRGSYRAVIEGWGSSRVLSLDEIFQPIVIQPNG